MPCKGFQLSRGLPYRCSKGVELFCGKVFRFRLLPRRPMRLSTQHAKTFLMALTAIPGHPRSHHGLCGKHERWSKQFCVMWTGCGSQLHCLPSMVSRTRRNLKLKRAEVAKSNLLNVPCAHKGRLHVRNLHVFQKILKRRMWERNVHINNSSWVGSLKLRFCGPRWTAVVSG